MANYLLRMMSLSDGSEVVRHYPDLNLADQACRNALLYEPSLLVEGVFDDSGKRVKTPFEQEYEEANARYAAERERDAEDARIAAQNRGCAILPVLLSIAVLHIVCFRLA